MASSNIQQNLIPNEPDLKDLVNLVKKDIFLNLNCHALGTIQSFDATKQTATATINYKRTYFQPDSAGVYQPVLVDYPILVDCPVVCLGGGNGALTFPISSGDECVVMFNDRDIDNWFQGSSGGAVATPRLHSFSDGLLLVGIRSLANVIVDYNEDAVELRNKLGTTSVAITDDDITLKVAGGAMTLVVDSEGKLTITNGFGEFVAALILALQTASAGGFPLVADLSILNTFKA